MIDFSKNIDPNTGLMGYAAWGELRTVDPEQDSPFHTCHYYYLKLLEDKYQIDLTERGLLKVEALDKIKQYQHSKGIYRRFPTWGQNSKIKGELNPSFGESIYAYYNFPQNLSRDNTLPIVLILGVLGETEELKAFIWNMVKRGSFFQNTHDTRGKRKVLPDLATPDHWSVILRAYLQASVKTNSLSFNIFIFMFIGPLLWLGDFFMIFSNLLTVIHSWYQPNHAPSELGHVCRTIQSELVYPTIFSRIAKNLYVYGRRTATNFLPDKIRHIGKSCFFKATLLLALGIKKELSYKDKDGVLTTFTVGESTFNVKKYQEDSPVMSGLNYFFRSKYDAPFPEFSRPFVKKYLDERA